MSELNWQSYADLTRPSKEVRNVDKPAAIPWKHIWLFIATVISTMVMGAENVGTSFFEILKDPSLILLGWQYSFALLLILTCHEFGHYFAAKYHRIDVTLPYYIPLPLFGLGLHFGTMGAVIRLKSPIPSRRALLDVAVAGPIAGFIVSLFFLAYGFNQLPAPEGIQQYVDKIHAPILENTPQVEGEDAAPMVYIELGKSLLFYYFTDFFSNGRLPMSEAYHFPFIFAGWIGLLITAINLLPIGQLDGGHVSYALFGSKAKYISYLAFSSIGIYSAFLIWKYGGLGAMWVLLMGLLLFIGLRHPPTMDDADQLGPIRIFLGWLCIAIFIVCFIPMPFFVDF